MKNTKFLIPILIYILFKIHYSNSLNENDILERKNNIYKNIEYANNGSIFKEKNIREKEYKSLFYEDKNYKVGDLISVIIQENTIATNKTENNATRYASSNLEDKEKINGISKISEIIKNFFRLNQKSENNLFCSGKNFSENFLSGTITVTVKEILPNKNLLVYGTKNIIINKGNEIIKFSGIINPNDIKKSSKIMSTKIANLKIEYLRNDYISDMQKMGWWHRFILNVIPI